MHGLYPRALACVNNMSPIAPEHPKRVWYLMPFGAMKTRSVRSRGAQSLALAVALAGGARRAGAGMWAVVAWVGRPKVDPWEVAWGRICRAVAGMWEVAR